MEAARTRYELRVVTLVSEAALATFRIPVRPTTVPRNTVYRFHVPADRDLSEVLQRLTERDVQVLEIRTCTEPRRRECGTARVPEEASQEEVAAEEVAPEEVADRADAAGGVVLPFRVGGRPRGGRSAR